MEIHFPKLFEERSARLGDGGAMEGGRHGKASAGDLARRERGFRLLDHRHRPGQHELFRGVSVGDDQIDRLGAKHVLDGLDRGQNGEHRASACFGFLGHQAAALSGEVEQSGVVDPTRGAERGQFAEAMPGEGVGLDAEVFEDFQLAKADRGDRRLRGVGCAELGFVGEPFGVVEGGKGINQVGEAVANGGFGQGEGVLKIGEKAGKFAAHADILRALAGEEERELPLRLARADVDPVLQAGFPGEGSVERSLGVLEERVEVGRAVEHQEKAVGIALLEAASATRRLDPKVERLQAAREGVELGFDRLGRRTREGKEDRVHFPIDRGLRRFGLFEQAVEIAAAEAEGAHRGASGMTGAGEPGTRLDVHVKGRLAGPKAV